MASVDFGDEESRNTQASQFAKTNVAIAIREAQKAGLSTDEFLDIAEFETVNNGQNLNMVFLKPLGSVQDIDNRIKAQDEIINRQKELKKTGADDKDAMRLAKQRKAILQKAKAIKQYNDAQYQEQIKALLNNLYVGKTADGSIEMNMSGFKNVTDSAGKFVSGPLGLTKIPKYATFEIAVVMVVLVYIICSHFIHSRDGRAVMAIRDNRIAAESVGINITKYKMIAFVLSSAMAGAAGCLYAHNYATLQAVKFDYNKSILILVFVVLGGIGNIKGSIVSAIILTLLPELLRGIGNYRMLIYSILLIVIMLINWSPKSRVVVQRLGAKIKGIFVKEKAAV